jgi:CubicO group peptidase (beta-lactamase class C family)
MLTMLAFQAGLRPSSPETQGIPAQAILDFVDAADRKITYFNSFMLLRHGALVAEGWWSPYAPERPHMLFSLSKSFTSTAVGLAVAEGRLTVDDKVVDFFPEDLPDRVSPNLAAMRVRHLLAMCTGHSDDTTGFMRRSRDGNWAAAFLRRPVTYEPGTHFLYNTGATYMLSAIVHKMTGMGLVDYLRPRLFDPLGIDYADWETCPYGIATGGFGLSVKTDAIARFGQLYLQKGVWQGRQLVPAEWIAEATAKHIDNGPNEKSEWEQGYGYQFWRCRHNCYRGDGAFGQYCIVMPEQDAVLAITSGVPDMQAVMDLVWKHLLPAMGPEPLAPNAEADAKLAARLRDLAIPPQAGKDNARIAKKVSGCTYVFEKNDQRISDFTLTFDEDGAIFNFKQGRRRNVIRVGHGEWIEGTAKFAELRSDKVCASGAWKNPSTYVVQLCHVETPFISTATLKFDSDQVEHTGGINVSFGPTQRPTLIGKRA